MTFRQTSQQLILLRIKWIIYTYPDMYYTMTPMNITQIIQTIINRNMILYTSLEGSNIQGMVQTMWIMFSFLPYNMRNHTTFPDRLQKPAINPPPYSRTLIQPLMKDDLQDNYWRNTTSPCHRQTNKTGWTHINFWITGALDWNILMRQSTWQLRSVCVQPCILHWTVGYQQTTGGIDTRNYMTCFLLITYIWTLFTNEEISMPAWFWHLVGGQEPII